MVKVAVLASGSGSNFENLVLAERSGLSKGYEIKILLSDKSESYALERAKKLGVKSFCVELKNFTSKDDYEKEIIRILKNQEIELIVLAGYMKIISKVFLDEYEGRIINIHPSYLPKYQGKDAIERAYQGEDKNTGVTVHYVDSGIDTGKIIEQEKIEINRDETLEELEKKVHELEYKIYPRVLTRICNGGKYNEKSFNKCF